MKQTAQDIRLGQVVRLLHAGRLTEARALATRLAKSWPKQPQLLSLLGTIHGRLGEFSQAESCYRTLAARDPRSHEHHYYLGMSLIMQGRLREAVPPFADMLRLRPGFAEGHMQMGCLLRDLGHHQRATEHFEEALRLNPALTDAAVFLANLKVFQGHFEAALGWLDHALQRQADHQEAIAAKALLLEKLGDTAAAMACLQPSLNMPVPSPGLAIAYATLAPGQQQIPAAQTLLRRVLSRQDLAPSQRQELHFALARLCDKAGAYDAAFEQYRAANALNRVPSNVAALRAQAERVMQLFDEVKLPDLPRVGKDSPRPVFIIGMPRSGTSLLETILACHPDVAAGGELETLPEIQRDMPALLGRSGSYPDCLHGITAAELGDLATRYREHIAGLAQGRRYITDKLPGNYERLGLIIKLFPEARIIHMQRDPRDTCLSCYFQNFGHTHPYSTDLRALGEVYELYQRYLDYWRGRLPDAWLDIRYELLVAQPETVLRRLLEYCDLPWNPACLDFHRSGRYINTASYAQVRQPLYQESVGRWHRYAAHLRELCDALHLPR